MASGGHSSSRCTGLSSSRPLLLRSTGSRRAGSVIVAHGPSCSAACGILSDQGSNPCPLHWQADSQPLRHQGSPDKAFFSPFNYCLPSCIKDQLTTLTYQRSVDYTTSCIKDQLTTLADLFRGSIFCSIDLFVSISPIPPQS